MHRWLSTLAVALVLLLVAVVPASAQTFIQLRYWSTNDNWYNGTFQPTFNSGIWGVTLRRDFMGGAWGASFNFDRGSVTSYSAGNLGSDAYNQFWNINIHRNFALAAGKISAFVGWQANNWEGPSGGVFIPYYIRQSGFRLGVDGMFTLGGGPWFLTGEVAYMPSQGATQSGWTVAGTQNESASMASWRAGVGYSVTQTISLEGGTGR